MPGTAVGRAAKLLAGAAQWLLTTGGTVLLAGHFWGREELLGAGKTLAVAGAVAEVAWAALKIADLAREGNACMLETYVTMVLWMLTPWGLYVQARQLLGEIQFRAKAISDVASYKPKLTVTPPFTGCWLVVNGGVTREESHSWEIVAQRFAYDLIAAGDADKAEKPYRYRRLEDWETYGSPILAAAPGVVVKAVDGIPDNKPVGRIRLRTVAEEYGEPLPERVKVLDVRDEQLVRALLEYLHRGEAEAITLAVEANADIVVLDDKRREAQQEG